MYADQDSSPLVLLPEGTILPHEHLARLWGNRKAWEDRLVSAATENPLESLATLLIGSSAAFYLAERGVNPRVKTFWDALYYITTCASVGYADVFAQTQTGKSIASVVFTFGPALCARVFERTTPDEARAAAELPQAVIGRLDAILAELQNQRGAAPSP